MVHFSVSSKYPILRHIYCKIYRKLSFCLLIIDIRSVGYYNLNIENARVVYLGASFFEEIYNL